MRFRLEGELWIAGDNMTLDRLEAIRDQWATAVQDFADALPESTTEESSGATSGIAVGPLDDDAGTLADALADRDDSGH